jgi:hypothetical protein
VLLELLEQLSVRPEGDPVPVVPAVEATTFRMEVDVKALRELLRNQQERLREEQSRFRELNREISVRRRVNAPEPGWSVPGWI